MQFDSLAAFLNMDGHGFYVWSCYALGALVIGWNLFAAGAQRRRFLSEEARRQRRAQSVEGER